VAKILTNDANASAGDAVGWIKNICMEMKIPPLKEFGLTESSIPEIVQRAKKSSSTKGNPVELTDEDLTQILKLAM
jgi:alcohol dehydrogenase class IV